MSGVEPRSHVAGLILSQLGQLLDRVAAMEQRLLERSAAIERTIADLADDVDAIDRFNKPYGDGTKPARRRGGL